MYEKRIVLEFLQENVTGRDHFGNVNVMDLNETVSDNAGWIYVSQDRALVHKVIIRIELTL
jgi:hypothetical protein